MGRDPAGNAGRFEGREACGHPKRAGHEAAVIGVSLDEPEDRSDLLPDARANCGINAFLEGVQRQGHVPDVPVQRCGERARQLDAADGGLRTGANTQPALASYLSDGVEPTATPAGLFVLTIDDQKIRAITRFHLDQLYPCFGLAASLPGPAAQPQLPWRPIADPER